MKNDEASEKWSPESMVGYWINRVSRALSRDLDARLRPLGFAMSQLPVLHALAHTPAMSQKELAKRARVEQPTMAEMLSRLERDGVVRREPNPEDDRGILISLTQRSRMRLGKARAALIDAENAAITGLNQAERSQLRDLLQRLANNVEPASAESLQQNTGAR